MPGRLDIGGTWDLKAFALLFEYMRPTTVNIAVDLPTELILTRREDDLIDIEDAYGKATTTLGSCDLRSRFGLLLAICTRFRYKGFHLQIEYTVPPRNGLGGSGALAAGFIAGMKYLFPDPNSEYPQIASDVHEVEESLRFSFCGMQDQCAALYGGVHKWNWAYNAMEKFTEERLLERSRYMELSDRLVVAYLGKPHQADVNAAQIDSMFDPRTRPLWFRINENTHEAAAAIPKLEWQTVARCIQRENDIRVSLIPARLAPEARPLAEAAKRFSSGFGIAGAGAGGCVFALCPDADSTPLLAEAWRAELSGIPGAIVFKSPAISNGIAVKDSAIGRAIGIGREDSGNRGLDARHRASVAL